jgi:UDP-N-acetylmuramoyl-L-alanyl-D-glutamate--2,6-diaminopimelate ligase
MRLNELVRDYFVDQSVGSDPEVLRIMMDSRLIQPGDLFVVYPGGEKFVDSAIERGAVAVISSVRLTDAVPNLVLEHFESALGNLCNRLYDWPTRDMKVIGITGTNGKTTTAWILRQIVENLGFRAGYIGTLGFLYSGVELRELPNTTPYIVELYNLLREARDAGVEYLAMEVSSHALVQGRVLGVRFEAAVFTNLSQDHLDFHGTMEAYEAAKWRLFSEFESKVRVANADDVVGAKWAARQRRLEQPILTHGKDGDLIAHSYKVGVDRIEAVFSFRDQAERFEVPLGGKFNFYNLQSAITPLLGMGFSLSKIREAAAKVSAVPGRFQPIPNEKGIGVIVDYAHTPDGLEKVLETAKELTSGELIVVFGCGGDRDKTKRPIMGRIAASLADRVYLTSDNPRTEDPERILDDIQVGVSEAIRISDRRKAIFAAIGSAKSGDAVVIAGKGHEDYQIIGKEKVHLDDREIAHDALTL